MAQSKYNESFGDGHILPVARTMCGGEEGLADEKHCYVRFAMCQASVHEA